MTITPKRRKLNKKHHQPVIQQLNSFLLGQSGGAEVPATNVEIISEGSGYYSMDVEVPITTGWFGPTPIMMMLCNNVIDIRLKCKGKYISYDDGSKVTCELVSVGGMNILIVVDGGNGQNEVISIPYSESFIDGMVGGLSTLIINEISVKGERNKILSSEKNSWDFKFNLNEILERKSGTINELIEKVNVDEKKIISKFLSFVEKKRFILRFKNIRVVTDNIPKDAIDIDFSVKNNKNLLRSLSPLAPQITPMLLDLNLNIINIPKEDTPISEKFSGDELVVSNFLKKCSITYDGGIIDIRLVQLIFIFFYIIIQDSVYEAKDDYQNANVKSNEDTSKQLFKKFNNNQTFFNFLSFVYMSISKLTNHPRDLTFKNIFSNMRKIAPQYKYLAPDLVFKKLGNASKMTADIDRELGGGGILSGGAPGDEDDNSGSLFKNISRIIPMQITKFNSSPQDMIVTITIPHVIAPFSKVDEGEEEGEGEEEEEEGDDSKTVGSNDSALNKGNRNLTTEELSEFLSSDYKQTREFIEQSLTKGQIKVQVGDCVQFVDGDGNTIKAIICFFKSGKYTYDSVIKYESASNIVDYWKSLERKVDDIVNQKEREPLSLISLLNLRGFAYLPYEEVSEGDNLNYTILYDCKSEIPRLHNGYNPSDKFENTIKRIGRLLTPYSTEFIVGSVTALKFNTASYMTLKKIDRPKMFEEFRKSLQLLGMADEKTIVRGIQTYIQQNGLSKLCGQGVRSDYVNRMNLFKQKVMNVDREFYNSGVFNARVNQYNVYKSNIFIQGLLNEKISQEDSVALFQSKYDPAVPELIYWFFTVFARGNGNYTITFDNTTRAMVMVFQAFASNNNRFKITDISSDKYPKILQRGGVKGSAEEEAAKAAAKAAAAVPGAAGEEDDEDDEEEGEEGDIVPSSAASASPTGVPNDADVISNYIKALIDIVRKNGLCDPQYLETLMSALKEALRKYTSADEDDISLFSTETANPNTAKEAMDQHIKIQDRKDEKAREAAEPATQAHTGQLELATASGKTSSRGAFDLSSLLKSRDGNNIDSQLGTCISGNNIVISCDGQTVRIDLDLATLLSTCADSFTQAALNGDIPKIVPGQRPPGEEGVEEEVVVEEEEEEDGDDEKRKKLEAAEAERKKLEAAEAERKKLEAAAAEAERKKLEATASATTIESVTQKYKDYDIDYKKFKDDPVYKYLDYDAKYQEFYKDAKSKDLVS